MRDNVKTQRKRNEPHSRSRQKILWVAVGLGAIGIAYGVFGDSEVTPVNSTSSGTAEAPREPERIPPFYESEEAAKPFPATLSPELFPGPYIAHAYRVAQQIPGVLAQQPCYCYCDRYGHGSLLDCYRDRHGAG